MGACGILVMTEVSVVLFGLKAPVVKCHGSSDAKAVYYTIKQVRTMLDTKVVEQLVEAFSPKEEAN